VLLTCGDAVVVMGIRAVGGRPSWFNIDPTKKPSAPIKFLLSYPPQAQ
jgi:hypothetical protein